MASTRPPPPAGYRAAVASWLRRLLPEEHDPRTTHRQAPLATYAVGRDDVAAGHLLARAVLVQWRTLLRVGDGPVQVLDLAPGDDGGWTFGAYTRGPLVDATADGVHALEALLAEDETAYEMRLLTVPALSFLAAWAHAEATDRLLPLVPGQQAAAPQSLLSPKAVLALLQPRARSARETPESN